MYTVLRIWLTVKSNLLLHFSQKNTAELVAVIGNFVKPILQMNEGGMIHRCPTLNNGCSVFMMRKHVVGLVL